MGRRGSGCFDALALAHDVGIDDEDEGHDLLERQPAVGLHPHQVAARQVHQDKPEVALCSLLGKLIGTHDVANDEPNFEPLAEGVEPPEVPEAEANA